jgi:hypothetical protein
MLSYPIRGGKRSFPHAPKYYSDYNRPIGLGIEAVPEFKSFQEMSNQRGRLGLRPELLRDPLHHEEKTFWELYRLLGKYRPKGLGEEENLINMVKAASTGDFKKFYPEVPEEIISKANEAVKNLQNKKVLYFEAAPRRSVDFNEFAGAIVPKNKMKSVAPRLKKIGLESIPYDDYDESLGEVMLRNFKDYSFAKGGKAKTNALQSKALKVANK